MTDTRDRDRPLVTDHAVIRYIERVLGVDLEKAREEIAAEGRAELIRAMRRGRLHTHLDGRQVTLEVVAGRVVTVKTKKEQPR